MKKNYLNLSFKTPKILKNIKATWHFLSLFLIITNATFAQTADVIVAQMGPGFNLGNVFDNGIKTATFTAVKPLIDAYKAEGMTHVRIPTSWIEPVNGNTLADANGNLITSNARFTELVTTIDYALAEGLYVVLNTHHEHWLKDHYDGSTYYNTIFTNLWTNIANYFSAYPTSLIFEVLNEPEGTMGVWDGPGGFPDPTGAPEILLTREIMQVGYDAIRATGGANATRVVMITTNGQGNDSQLEEVYPNTSFLPGLGTDDYLAMHVHSYDPWEFCGQTGDNANYTGAQTVIDDITATATHANLLGLPVNYGEFGVGRQTNQTQRNTQIVREYYATFMQTGLGNNMAMTVWDDRGWFGLINDSGSTFTYNIVPTMLQNLLTINFIQPTATQFNVGDTIAVEVIGSNNEAINAQLYINDVKVVANENVPPYNWGATRDTQLMNMAQGSYTLKAIATLDSNPVISAEATYNFTVGPALSTPLSQGASKKISLYPNPATHFLTINIPSSNMKTLEVYATSGKKIMERKITGESIIDLNINNLSRGLYLIKFIGETNAYSKFLVE